MVETDVVIIGAGPGGSATAIALNRRGFDVIVLEKKHFPRDKVCGEFIAPVGVKELERLGVLNEVIAAGAKIVKRIVLYSSKGAKAEISFRKNEFALAMSRKILDTLLFNHSCKEGVRGIEGIRVESVEKEQIPPYKRVEGSYNIGKSIESFRSKVVINASGLNGIGTEKKGYRGSLYAFKIHLKDLDCKGATELFFYEGGYGGIVNIEEGLVSLAFQVQKNQVALMTEHPMDILRQILPASHPMSQKLLEAKPVDWIAMGSVYYRSANLLPGVWNIGDASGLIDPFTGLGISLAIQGGRFIGETLDVAKEYKTYNLKLALNRKRFITTAILRNVLFHPAFCHQLIKYTSIFNHLGKAIIRLLHN
jgi:flavin-dependent dehydrogenase